MRRVRRWRGRRRRRAGSSAARSDSRIRQRRRCGRACGPLPPHRRSFLTAMVGVVGRGRRLRGRLRRSCWRAAAPASLRGSLRDASPSRRAARQTHDDCARTWRDVASAGRAHLDPLRGRLRGSDHEPDAGRTTRDLDHVEHVGVLVPYGPRALARQVGELFLRQQVRAAAMISRAFIGCRRDIAALTARGHAWRLAGREPSSSRLGTFEHREKRREIRQGATSGLYAGYGADGGSAKMRRRGACRAPYSVSDGTTRPRLAGGDSSPVRPLLLGGGGVRRIRVAERHASTIAARRAHPGVLAMPPLWRRWTRGTDGVARGSVVHVGHSTHLLCIGGLRLLTDPWFYDPAFGALAHELAAGGLTEGRRPARRGPRHPRPRRPRRLARASISWTSARLVLVATNDLAARIREPRLSRGDRPRPVGGAHVEAATITAVPGLHDIYEIGFVVQGGGTSVYFAGDSRLHPDLLRSPSASRPTSRSSRATARGSPAARCT